LGQADCRLRLRDSQIAGAISSRLAPACADRVFEDVVGAGWVGTVIGFGTMTGEEGGP